jgi:hypothetical protein
MTDPLKHLIQMHDLKPWDDLCRWAEQNIPALHRHLETWGHHCGAPRDIYRGHLVKMLLDIAESALRAEPSTNTMAQTTRT